MSGVFAGVVGVRICVRGVEGRGLERGLRESH